MGSWGQKHAPGLPDTKQHGCRAAAQAGLHSPGLGKGWPALSIPQSPPSRNSAARLSPHFSLAPGEAALSPQRAAHRKQRGCPGPATSLESCAPSCPPDVRKTQKMGSVHLPASPPSLPSSGMQIAHSPERVGWGLRERSLPRAPSSELLSAPRVPPGPALTQQDEGDEQHDEDGDAEDERKPPLAHAGSSEHRGSWQWDGGRVGGSHSPPGHPDPAAPPPPACALQHP